jgi:putative effector of murein hydrolase
MEMSDSWENDLKGLVGGDKKEQQKIEALKEKFKEINKSNKGRKLLLFLGFPLLFIAVICFLWAFTDFDNSMRGDIANAIIAFASVVSILFTSKLKTIDQEVVKNICGKSVPGPVLVKMRKQVGFTPDKTQKVIAVIVAVALVVVVFCKALI